jgi:hypothetical protein
MFCKQRDGGVTWVKGRSGNPNGAPPRDQQLSRAISTLLRKKDPETGQTNKALIAQALVSRAIRGDIEAIRTVLERVDGKVPTPVEHSGRDGAPIGLTFDYGHAVADLASALVAAGPGRDRLPPGEAEVFGDGPALGEDPDGR